MKSSNIWRLLKILLMVCRYDRIKAKRIADELEISTRQIYRDINCLKYAGVPIYSDRNGYSVASTFFMPKISLNLLEVITLILFLNSIKSQKGTPYLYTLNTVSEKIINLLPGDLKRKIMESNYNGIVDFGLETKIDYKKIEDVFKCINSAQLEKKSILIKYYSIERKKENERIVDPYALKFRFGVWYMIGYCSLRKCIRTFRIDRIKNIKMLDKSFSVPADFSLDKYLSGSWGIKKGKKYKVKLKFNPQIAEFISEVTWHPSQKLKHGNNGSLYAEYEITGLDEIERWILGFGADVEVIEPEKLRKDIACEINKLRRVYS